MAQLLQIEQLSQLIHDSVEACWSDLAVRVNSAIYGFSLTAVSDFPRTFCAIGASASTEKGFGDRKDAALKDASGLQMVLAKCLSNDEQILHAQRWQPWDWEHKYLCGSYKNLSGCFSEATEHVRNLERSLHPDHSSYRKFELPPEVQRSLKAEVFAAMTIALQRFSRSVATAQDSSSIVWFCTYSGSDSVWLEQESAMFLNSKTRYDQFAGACGSTNIPQNQPVATLFREILSGHSKEPVEPAEESQHQIPARSVDDKEPDKRTLLIREIIRQYDLEEYDTLPLIRFEQFFDGNFDDGSIAANAGWKDIPDLNGIFAELTRISELPAVADVFVTVHECPEEDDEEVLDMWPQAEGLVITTTLGLESLQAELSALKPDYCNEGWAHEGHEATRPVPELKQGYRAYTIGWD